MTIPSNNQNKQQSRRLRIPISRRGIASVLAMMFLIIFGSLVAAMAVASTGNIRTANMHLHVMRAMSAAETGLAVAEHRLNEASSRFVVAESDLDADITWALWKGDSSLIGTYEVAPPRDGYAETVSPAGIAEALVNAHSADENILTGYDYTESAEIETAPSDIAEGVYESSYWVNTPPILMSEWEDPDTENPPPAYQIRYAPLAGGHTIRVIVEGIVYDFQRNNKPIRRIITRDYQIIKSVDQAIIAHSKILIGKNVQIEGELGARFDEVDFDAGDPIVMRSDFLGLDSVLDTKITAFFEGLLTHDIDGDNRLRVGHPIEGAGIPADADFDGDGDSDGAFNDATQDGYIDEIDIFIRHYDTNNDNRVTLSAALIEGTRAGLDGSAPEFVGSSGEAIDEDLALLIDGGRPDRNENGVFGFLDINNDRIYQPEDEDPIDYDAFHDTYSDEELGWRDGYIDAMDRYAKVQGRLVFKVEASDWETGQGDIHDRLHGPIVPDDDESPLEFGADDLTLPDINADSFTDTENALIAAADGDPFWQQVADQLGTSTSSLSAWTLDMNPSGDDEPHLFPIWDDTDYDGLPDNYDWAYFENAPYNSPSYSDVYWRPVFENMVFRNVKIPMGLNALFVNCTFVGSSHVQTYTQNTHPLWSEYGANIIDAATGMPTPKFPRFVYGDDPGEDASDAPPMLPSTAVPPDQMILMTDLSISPLDTGDVPQSEVAAFGESYNLLPEPIVIDGKRVVDTKKFSNNLRFHDCLFVGSVVSDTPTEYTQVRNKLQFTGATRFTTVHPDEPDNSNLNPDENDMDDILTSSMMLPNYSVDLGSFNSPPEQNITLQGAIIAGVLDARGNTTIDGALLLTFDPTYGEGPLLDVSGNPIGNPAGFNASLGYFGSEDGDYESIDPNDLPIVGGVRIIGYDTNDDGLVDVSYDEPQPAGSTPIPFNGFGKIRIRHNPNMRLPSGLMLPLAMPPVSGTYQEGSY
ncbi:MAG: hypothetical protein CMJ35_05245 [Phycisphaerae bacterium]|nr:hypothetical protein [Phycisphaerae bacterium]MBM91007.1 hypothetical protein [Phycisphaerae bacterium]